MDREIPSLTPINDAAPRRGPRPWDWTLGLGLGVGGAVLRAVAVPELLGDLDAVNFGRALESFDPRAQAPHFPGYAPYVGVARLLLELGVRDPVWALALPAILLWPAAATVGLVGLSRLVGRWPALGAVALASLAPAAVVAGGWPGADGLGLLGAGSKKARTREEEKTGAGRGGNRGDLLKAKHSTPERNDLDQE